MDFRTKLLLAFLSISILIIVVGVFFYSQLNNLIGPLTPESIPNSIEQLTEDFNQNNYVFNLSEQELRMKRSFENYLLTGNQSELKKYYLNKGLLSNLLQHPVPGNEIIAKELNAPFSKLEQLNNSILNSPRAYAINLLNQTQYSENRNAIRAIIDKYHHTITSSSYENANIISKLAQKNLKNILKHNLNITLIIFLNAIIISFIFAFFAARMISEPIKNLQNNIDHMRHSNLHIPFNNTLLTTAGEVGDLARSFSELINNLRATTVWRDELLQEIERRKQFEESLKATALRLQKTNKDLDQFAYMASHDLRSPLRGIESLVNWIQEDYYHLLPEDAKHYFDLIKKRAERLEFLINGILEYSRAGRMETQSTAIDVSDLIFELIDTIDNPRHVKFSLDTPLPILMTNKTALTQVFLNLLSNAVKYNNKQEGQVNIGCTQEGNFYQFYVADNGPGIAPEFYDKIFEIFQTLQARDTIEGSGIGLAIVKKIVEDRGGKVWVESEVGKGSTFYFTWQTTNEAID